MKCFILMPFVICLVVMNIQMTNSLSCHQCSTVTSPSCADPFAPPANLTATLCPTDREYTFCRKIWQKVRGKVDVMRMCGYVKHKNECYSTRVDEYKTLVCQCEEDMCNMAVSVMQESMVLQMVMVLMLPYLA